ncbi:hypothetical protein [Rhodohalobacter sulfatireducens]|uniref:Bacteriocin n=1 Tax=Rhodohalobacter sulfatireducens TaxID=2911366 RepID=A0ABS9KEA9_9BACT|nr:hypothetical protein [Rhodohalobacter sulfatireducens]MCG2589189.1 hypothetical protein [Rhodohalobacter sulfatireducens]
MVNSNNFFVCKHSSKDLVGGLNINQIRRIDMRTLSLEKMEQIEGGDLIGCLGAHAATIALLGGVAALSGPVGWGVAIGFAAGGYGAGLAIGYECL